MASKFVPLILFLLLLLQTLTLTLQLFVIPMGQGMNTLSLFSQETHVEVDVKNITKSL
jgi:hypothetical protein